MIIDMLDEIKGESSTLKKLDLLRDLFENKIYKNIFKYAYDPFYVYGIKGLKVKRIGERTLEERDLKIFFLMLDSQRKNPTNSKANMQQFESFLSNFDRNSQEYLIKIINKDLEIGINKRSIAKIDPILLDLFEVQLAHILDDKKLVYPVAIEPKFDGLRGIWNPKEKKLFTRNMNEITGYNNIKKELLQLGTKFCFDGEMMDKNFQSTISKIFTKEKKIDTETRFFVFDLFPVELFKSNAEKWDEPFSKRRNYLERVFKAFNFKYLVLVENKIANNYDEIIEKYNEYLKENLEGLMLKRLDSPYTFGRTFDMMKLKPVYEIDMQVLEVLEGNKGRLKGIAKSLRCVSLDGKYRADVQGLSDDLAKYFWDNKNKNLTIEVLYGSITEDNSLRFPRIKKIRDDL